MKEELPFTPTPVIQRYLQVMVNVITASDKYEQIHNGKIKNPITIGTYDDDETIFSDFEENRLKFLKYLESEKAVKETESEFEEAKQQCFKYPPGLGPMPGENGLTAMKRVVYYPEFFTVQILDAQKIIDLQKRVFAESGTKTELVTLDWDCNTGKLIFKDKNHTFQLRKGKNPLLVLFDVLWGNRQEKGKRTRNGKLMERADIVRAISNRRNITSSLARKELPSKIKSINRILCGKRIQIEIIGGEEDTQMVVTL